MDRIYFVGAGVIARAHAAAARRLSVPLEVRVHDPSAAALAAFKDENPDAIPHDSVESLLADPPRDSDLVIIATPPASHAALTLQALASGRHVLCEKPLATSLEEALAMRDAAAQAGRHLMDCSMRFMGDPSGDTLRQAIQAGVLGEIYHVTCRHVMPRSRSGIEYQPGSRWFLNRRQSGGGVLMDWGVYDLATLFEVLRPRAVDVVQAWMSRPETGADPKDAVFDVETHIGATLRAEDESGRSFVIDYERASGTHADQKLDMQIEGTRGAAAWKWIPFPVETTELRLRTDAAGKISEAATSFATADTVHFHHRPLVFSRRLIAGQATPVLADDDALFNFGVIQAIYQAATDARSQGSRQGDRVVRGDGPAKGRQ